MSLITFSISLIISLLLVATAPFHQRVVNRNHSGPQQLHTGYVPRLGGVAIGGALLAGCYGLAGETQYLLFSLLLASAPVLLIGLCEDITARISATIRLVVTLITGLMFIVITDVRITDVHISYIDWMLQISWLSMLVTILAIATLTNAVNIIDGLNGLSIGTTIIMVGAIGIIAKQAGDSQLFIIAMIFGASLLGCFILNFPFGRIFAGDGGAYLSGALVAMLAILLSERNDGISAFASLIIIFYPFYELLRSTIRRKVTGRNTMAPDTRHLHSLIYAYISRNSQLAPYLANSISAVISWSLPLFGAVVALSTPTHSKWLFGGVVVTLILYEIATYWLKQQIVKR